MRKLENVAAPMRDGVLLRMDLYMPDDQLPHPVLLMRTPYGKQYFDKEPVYCDAAYQEAGYIVAVQDCRGTGESDGILHCNGDYEYPDGYDSIEWIATQEWCNGHVGMIGLSYVGFDQMAAAVMAPPHLDAISPFMTQVLPPYGTSIRQTVGCYHLGWVYGQLLREIHRHIPDKSRIEELKPILEENFKNLDACNWKLPMNQNPAATIPGIPMLEEYLRVVNGCENQEFWHSIYHPSDVSKLTSSTFHATGWFDAMKDTTVDNYQAVRDHGSEYAKKNNKLLIGPWTHSAVMDTCHDGVDFGEENSRVGQNVTGQLIRWFNRYMKPECADVDTGAQVRYYVMVENAWREDTNWPPLAAADTPLYLQAGGKLAKEAPKHQEPDGYDYDPDHPMPAFHRDDAGHGIIPDWSSLKTDAAYLEYQSEPLQEPITIAGTVFLDLYAQTDAKDTDFSCRILDVAPDGFAFEMAAGIIRAKYRDAVLFKPNPITPGKVEHYRINVGNTARRLEKGHVLKIQVSSALYPAHDRNLNTGAVAGQTAETVVAHQKIYHDEQYASHLVLPVIPNA